MSQRRLFALIALALLAVVTAQNLGTPRNAGPDEPAHIVRGAGLVRGQFSGERYGDWLVDHEPLDPGGADITNADPDSDGVQVFDVPRWIAQPSATCYAHDPNVSAACSTVVDTNGDGALTTAASYPIWSHLLPGLATLLISGSSALWLARLLHGLIPILLIAATIAHLVVQGRRTAASAVLVATTPMVLFLVAVVNPSGLAISGSIALWVAADDACRASRPPSWLFAAGFAALVLPRDDGLVWAALLLAVVCLVGRRSPIDGWRILPNPTRAVLGAVTLVGAGWAALAGGDLVPVDRPATGIEFAEIVVQRTGLHLREAVGVLGWLDTALPESTYALWFFAAGLVMMVALVTRDYRRAVGAASALAAFVVVGWLLEVVQGRTAGLFWQGRYALPMLVGMVIVAGLSVDADRRIGPVAAATPGVLALVVWNWAFLQQLRRWGVGQFGSIRPWAWDTWNAPVPVLALVVVHVAGSVALGWLCWGCAAGAPAPTRDRLVAGSHRDRRDDRSTGPVLDGS